MSAAVAAVWTYGMVFSGMYFKEDPLPVSAYQGFFRQVLLTTERLWSYAHGWQPMSHIRDFGRFYAPMVQLICPLIGFGLFWLISRHKVGINVWKPMGIALLLALPPAELALAPFYAMGLAEQGVQVVRTLFIVLLMMWSVGAIRIVSKHHARTAESLATS
jgi:hypothetical protein